MQPGSLKVYYPYFVTYMLMGFVVSLVVFIWALNSGQFKDQQRARYLPLQVDTAAAPARSSRIRRIELLALFALVCAGLMITAAVLAFALLRGGA